MNRLAPLALALSLTLTPTLSFAYNLNGAERPSRRSVQDMYQKKSSASDTRLTPEPQPQPSTDAYFIGDLIPALPASGLSWGKEDAPVTMVEFVDYACPFCGTFAGRVLPKIVRHYVNTGTVRFVVRNFPISYHPAAAVAAQAVECSREQSDAAAKELSAALLKKTAAAKELTQTDVYAAFQSIKGLDAEKMYLCIDSGAKQAFIEQDIKDAESGGVNGVPSFWVHGKNGKAVLVQGAMDFSVFRKVIENMQK